MLPSPAVVHSNDPKTVGKCNKNTISNDSPEIEPFDTAAAQMPEPEVEYNIPLNHHWHHENFMAWIDDENADKENDPSPQHPKFKPGKPLSVEHKNTSTCSKS